MNQFSDGDKFSTSTPDTSAHFLGFCSQGGAKRRLDLSGDACISKIMKTKCPSYSDSFFFECEKSRSDTSLGVLTRKFMQILHATPDKILDLNHASEILRVQKRRIYDITNVLEGVGLVLKISKNKVQWRGFKSASSKNKLQMKLDIELLKRKEAALEELVNIASRDLENVASESKNLAYLTEHDLTNVLRDHNIFVIRAPPGTKLEVSESFEHYQLHLSSQNGPIQAFSIPHLQGSDVAHGDSGLHEHDLDQSISMVATDPSIGSSVRGQACVQQDDDDDDDVFKELMSWFTEEDSSGICDMFDGDISLQTSCR